MKKKLLQYGITAVVGALIALWVMNIEGMFLLIGAGAPGAILSILCDAFFVPGILLVLFGALMWVANTGFFDSLGYALRTAAHMFLPFMKTERKSYYDYKTEKADKRGSTPYFMFIVGVVYMVLAVVFLLIWTNMPA